VSTPSITLTSQAFNRHYRLRGRSPGFREFHFMQRRFAMAACAAGVISSFSVHAQQANSAVDDSAIIVTASRFRSSAIDQPIAVQIITADEIRNSSATTVAEVLNKLGGVHTRISFIGVPDSPLDLRGFGMTGNENTLVLVNGQRISENEQAAPRLSAIPINAIERIEILRGAGAVLYGSGATGGTINIITRAATGSLPSGSASATFGSHSLRDLRGSAEAGSGGWGISVNGQHTETDNYRKNNRAEQDAASGELRFGDRNDFIALNLGGDSQKARLPGPRNEVQLKTAPRETSTPNDYMNTRSQIVSLRGEKRFDELTLALDVGHREKTMRFFSDFGFGFSSKQDTEVKVDSISPRLHWTAPIAGLQNRLTVGFDWSEWSYTNDWLNTFGNRDEIGSQRNRAVYFRDELALTPSTRISLGARREHVDLKQEERLTPIPKASVSHDLSAYELALQQDLGRGVFAYGRLGKSFRVGNIDDNRCYGLPCNPLLKPQRSHEQELGLQWRGKGSSLRISLFDIDLDDEIHFNAITFTNMNLSPTQRRGLELEGKAALGETVDVSGRYAHTTARFRSGIYFGNDVSGNDVPLVPQERIGLMLDWQPVPATRLSANVNYVGKQRYDNDQVNRFRSMPDYTITDIKLSHEIGQWRLAAGVNNLFDKAYYSYGIVNGAFTSFNAYPEDRRNGYVSAEFRW
jgi:iron complex outermembrane receptor protein